MKKVFLSLTLVLATCASYAQTSMGMLLGGTIGGSEPKGQALDNSFMFGISLKKYLTPTLNLVSGGHLGFYDATARNLPINGDLITYYKDAHPNEFFYVPDGEYFRFTYFVVPVGLEYKVTTFLRVAYTFENNILLGSSESVGEYLEHGKKSVAPWMYTNRFSLLLHTGNAFGFGLHATFNPQILRNDIRYSYEFMHEFNDAFRKSYLFSFSLWADFAFKKRKKL
ncbi:MAG TPA: hypothetical protein VKZ68_05865 [Ohtaekwangia sp.]|nr:hypothetical protein [Ohtaekwangia sp.]